MEFKSKRLEIRAENKARQENALKTHFEQINPDSFKGRYERLDKIIYPGCEYCGGDH
jgi:hypothetical protein